MSKLSLFRRCNWNSGKLLRSSRSFRMAIASPGSKTLCGRSRASRKKNGLRPPLPPIVSLFPKWSSQFLRSPQLATRGPQLKQPISRAASTMQENATWAHAVQSWVGTSGAAGAAKLAAVLVTYPHEVRRRAFPSTHLLSNIAVGVEDETAPGPGRGQSSRAPGSGRGRPWRATGRRPRARGRSASGGDRGRPGRRGAP